MKEKLKKPRVFIPVIAAICIVIGLAIYFGRSGGAAAPSGSNSVVPVVTVQDLMNPGSGSGSDTVNRFAGVVETQDSWSVNQNQEVEVREIFVKEGQEVKKGDPLFAYDTEKYESDLEQAKIDLERLKMS
jgi:HlyD family secretion protein